MGYFPDGATNRVNHPSFVGPNGGLESAVERLSVKAKQAFYAVLSGGGTMARKTWSGCAFNAASNGRAFSVGTAAQQFGMSPSDVEAFIQAWDGSTWATDEAASRGLRQMLDRVGICTPPKHERQGGRTRIVRGYVYKSQATKFKEQLDSGELTVAMIPGCEEAAQLLCNA